MGIEFHPQERLSHQNRRKATAEDLEQLAVHNRALDGLAGMVAACLARQPTRGETAAARKRRMRAAAKLYG